MGRLDREPRPSREELDSTLKFVAETDNLDGEAYTLAAEVRALREELATLRDDVFEERHIGVMTISIPRVPDGDAGRAFLGAVAELVKAARAHIVSQRDDIYGHPTDELEAALKPFEGE